MKEKSKPRKSAFGRKHYLILPSYQLKLTFFLIILLLIGSLIHGFFLYRITEKGIEEGFFSAHNRLRSTWEILKPAIVLTNGLSFLILSLSFILVTILTSHRLIGPLFKIERRVRELSKGHFDLPPITLRHGDEAVPLSNAVNELQDAYRDRLKPIGELKKRWKEGNPPTESEIKEAVLGLFEIGSKEEI